MNKVEAEQKLPTRFSNLRRGDMFRRSSSGPYMKIAMPLLSESNVNAVLLESGSMYYVSLNDLVEEIFSVKITTRDHGRGEA